MKNNIPYPEKVCPSCSCKVLLDGPKGGFSQNVLCSECGREWNYTPMGFQSIDPPRPELYQKTSTPMTVDVILQEIDIRINKLKEFEAEANKIRDVDLHRATRIRRQEYESFKNWIEIRK
jgi:hypothetical protein